MVLREVDRQLPERRLGHWNTCASVGCGNQVSVEDEYCIRCQLDGRAPLREARARRPSTYISRTQEWIETTPAPMATHGGLTSDPARFRFLVNDQPLKLKPAMYFVLVRLFEHYGEVVTYRRLSEGLGGGDESTAWESLRVLINWLRRELARHDGAPRIENLKQFGYMLRED